MCCWSYTEIDYKLLIFSCTRWIDNATWDSLCSVKFYLKNSNVKVRAFNHRVQVIIHRHHTTPGHLSKVIRFQPVPCWNIVIITKNTSDSQTHRIMEIIHHLDSNMQRSFLNLKICQSLFQTRMKTNYSTKKPIYFEVFSLRDQLGNKCI